MRWPTGEGGRLPIFLVAIVLGIVVTWGISLAPVLLIRYVFVKRPLDRRKATWIAGASCGAFWFLSLAANAVVGEKPGSFVVWGLMFFVARWVLSRGEVDSTPAAPQVI
jgi:hypothetical protein